MALYLKSGTSFNVTTKDALDIQDTLPVGAYSAKQTCDGQHYLERIDSLDLDGIILYGRVEKDANRILGTFEDRKSSTGVLLTGEKGSGKTLLSKIISTKAAKQNIPTIVINEPLHGESFNEFMQMIKQPAIVLFDEFEKVYELDEHQNALLTLLDGTYATKKLFIFTTNETHSLNRNLMNRPGRIFYLMEFHGVDDAFIREYCKDHLQVIDHVPMICRLAKMFSAFNYDLLQGMVEEMNRYNESPAEVLKYLNARPKYGGDQQFRVKLYSAKNKRVDLDHDSNWNGNPFSEDISLYHDNGCAEFRPADIVHVTGDKGEYVLVNRKRERLVLRAIDNSPVDLASLVRVDKKSEKKIFPKLVGNWFRKSKQRKQEKVDCNCSESISDSSNSLSLQDDEDTTKQ